MSTPKYVEQFFSFNFEPYQHLTDNIIDSNNLIHNQIPMVEFPNLDIEVLKQIYNFCLDNIDRFTIADTQNQYNKLWYHHQHTDGWKQFAVRENRPEPLGTFQKETVFVENPIHTDDTTNVAADLIDQLFKPFGLTIRHCRLSVLEPGGYFAPHIDIFKKDPGFCYFWVPLHDVNPHMKIFPFGWVNSKFGNMYLFNYSKYTHSVWNRESQPRFILGAVFDIENVPAEFIELFRQHKESFRQLFRQSV